MQECTITISFASTDTAGQVEVTQWGDSLAIRLPREVAEQAGLTEGTRVDIKATDDGRVIISHPRRRFSLAELLADMTPGRKHRASDDGW